MAFSVLDLIMYAFAKHDDYLTGTYGHATKKDKPKMEVPTRLKGSDIEYNETILKEMGEGHREIQMGGELIHLALGHPDRMKALVGTVDQLRPVAEIAFMLATYHTLGHDNRKVSPEKFIVPSMFKDKDGNPFPEFKSSEEYFKLLMDKINKDGTPLPDPSGQGQGQQGQGQGQQGQGQQGQGQGQQGQGQGQQGQGQQGQPPDPVQQLLDSMGVKQQVQQQDTSGWGSVPTTTQEMARIMLKEELTRHKSRGTLPAGMARLLEQLDLEEEEDWKQIIEKMVGSKFSIRKFKGTMKKPSRRLGIGFPGRKRIKRGALVYAIDSSGSMSDTDVSVCVANGKQIAKRYGAPFLCLVCDAAIHTIKMIRKSVDLEELEILGGGGTSSLPVFDYLEENRIKTDLLVYVTDLYIDFPEEKPDQVRDMVWAVINNPESSPPPFGHVLHLKMPEDKK